MGKVAILYFQEIHLAGQVSLISGMLRSAPHDLAVQA